MNSLIEKFYDGSPFFTFPILVLLILILVLFVKGIRNRNDNSKTIALISSLGWFTFAWGFLGRTVGLIGAFDVIAAAGDVIPSMIADGLKMALVNPLFALTVFLIARLGIIILVWMQKEKSPDETQKTS